MSHRNARLTPTGRRIMIERIAAGTPQAHVAQQMLVSRATVSKWWRRWLAEGDEGLEDRSSRPRRSPTRTAKRVEDRVCRLRRSKRWGPRMISMHTGVPASTVHKILVRHGLNRLAWIDRPTERVIRRYERAHPGELIHLDIKKVGKIPPGGGWRVRGRGKVKTRRVGYTYLHCAVDDHSRVAYVEAHDNEQAETLLEFWSRAQDWFWAKGMTVDEVMSDNGSNFRSRVFAELLAERAIRTPAHPPLSAPIQRQGRAVQPNHGRRVPLLVHLPLRDRTTPPPDRWVHDYNHHRNHTAVGGPPASRVHNVCGSYT